MRIRKHAKISGHLFSQTSGSYLLPQRQLLQTHVCQLNQSPWDVINFPPDSASTSPYQVDIDDSFTGNGSLGDSIGPVESVASMKISVEEEKEIKEEDGPSRVFSGEREGHLGLENAEAIMCCKSDGKGWQCRRVAKEGHSLCEHHWAQLRNYSSLAHPGSKKSDKASEKGAAIRRRPRTKKASVSNPHEFYYYSGFGPRWGKKRGNTVEVANVSSDTKLVVEPEITTASSSHQIDDEVFDYIEEDDDDDDDEDENRGIGKKRGRKPIKARSLKSLM
ncbi:uncharacterized protein LOC132279665 [Cornus florida]|uniref:uncharacterized protein LOC132279665 n=1 Tax=Cornus florida TaxID=4283 RepID=UPI00289D1AB5|nr:uncharacterized protein LOC132279665 [Cornus florida]